MRWKRTLIGGLAPFLMSGIGVAQEATSCVTCHSDADLFEEADRMPVIQHASSIHASVGLSCHDCHGGNPDPALADDLVAAMDEGFADNPFIGAPEVSEIPSFCGRCHSDPTFMNRYNPDLRTDQEQEYWTSHHGKKLREGHTGVATCVACHGAHNIVAAAAPESPTYPTHVAETCGHCHSNPEVMAGAVRADGSPLPTDQLARWRQSVHAAALLEREDLSAPTCNDCHGNHGATPPGLETLAFVCGQCHGREAELFRASPKRALLADHEEYLADAGEEGCAACHEESEPQAHLEDFHSFGECNSCHNHHAVVRPGVAMLSPLPETPCAFCHESESERGGAVDPVASGRQYQSTKISLLESADQGLSRDALFDWLVDQAQRLPFHTVSGEEGGPTLKPEFARLFQKFRIRKTHFPLTESGSETPMMKEVMSCGRCHGPEPALGEATGNETAATFLSRFRELTTLSAQAERKVLTARRGGVEVGKAQEAIDQAVDAQIELQVLVHTFSAEPDSPFMKKHEEGLAHASDALQAADVALGELSSRRRGLWVSLFFIALLLVALALKIRNLPD